MATTKEIGPVKFHLLPEDSAALNKSLGSVEVSGQVLRDKLDEFCKLTVLERCNEFKLLDRLVQQMDRRIEVAIKEVMPRLEAEDYDLSISQVRRACVGVSWGYIEDVAVSPRCFVKGGAR